MASLFTYILFFLLIGYLISRIFNFKVVLRVAIVLGIIFFIVMQVGSSFSHLDTQPTTEQNIKEFLTSLLLGLVAFISIVAGGKLGILFKGASKNR